MGRRSITDTSGAEPTDASEYGSEGGGLLLDSPSSAQLDSRVQGRLRAIERMVAEKDDMCTGDVVRQTSMYSEHSADGDTEPGRDRASIGDSAPALMSLLLRHKEQREEIVRISEALCELLRREPSSVASAAVFAADTLFGVLEKHGSEAQVAAAVLGACCAAAECYEADDLCTEVAARLRERDFVEDHIVHRLPAGRHELDELSGVAAEATAAALQVCGVLVDHPASCDALSDSTKSRIAVGAAHILARRQQVVLGGQSLRVVAVKVLEVMLSCESVCDELENVAKAGGLSLFSASSPASCPDLWYAETRLLRQTATTTDGVALRDACCQAVLQALAAMYTLCAQEPDPMSGPVACAKTDSLGTSREGTVPFLPGAMSPSKRAASSLCSPRRQQPVSPLLAVGARGSCRQPGRPTSVHDLMQSGGAGSPVEQFEYTMSPVLRGTSTEARTFQEAGMRCTLEALSALLTSAAACGEWIDLGLPDALTRLSCAAVSPSVMKGLLNIWVELLSHYPEKVARDAVPRGLAAAVLQKMRHCDALQPPAMLCLKKLVTGLGGGWGALDVDPQVLTATLAGALQQHRGEDSAAMTSLTACAALRELAATDATRHALCSLPPPSGVCALAALCKAQALPAVRSSAVKCLRSVLCTGDESAGIDADAAVVVGSALSDYLRRQPVTSDSAACLQILAVLCQTASVRDSLLASGSTAAVLSSLRSHLAEDADVESSMDSPRAGQWAPVRWALVVLGCLSEDGGGREIVLKRGGLDTVLRILGTCESGDVLQPDTGVLECCGFALAALSSNEAAREAVLKARGLPAIALAADRPSVLTAAQRQLCAARRGAMSAAGSRPTTALADQEAALRGFVTETAADALELLHCLCRNSQPVAVTRADPAPLVEADEGAGRYQVEGWELRGRLAFQHAFSSAQLRESLQGAAEDASLAYEGQQHRHALRTVQEAEGCGRTEADGDEARCFASLLQLAGSADLERCRRVATEADEMDGRLRLHATRSLLRRNALLSSEDLCRARVVVDEVRSRVDAASWGSSRRALSAVVAAAESSAQMLRDAEDACRAVLAEAQESCRQARAAGCAKAAAVRVSGQHSREVRTLQEELAQACHRANTSRRAAMDTRRELGAALSMISKLKRAAQEQDPAPCPPPLDAVSPQPQVADDGTQTPSRRRQRTVPRPEPPSGLEVSVLTGTSDAEPDVDALTLRFGALQSSASARRAAKDVRLLRRELATREAQGLCDGPAARAALHLTRLATDGCRDLLQCLGACPLNSVADRPVDQWTLLIDLASWWRGMRDVWRVADCRELASERSLLQKAIGEVAERMEPAPSGRAGATTALSVWHTPRGRAARRRPSAAQPKSRTPQPTQRARDPGPQKRDVSAQFVL
eukprot:TRINITY_DN39698_c0_g1_i1.p1 TRINITY_DN39698_c0_g1~~TRINITY_DN39698_c0_g1_i1.p1  ORF type:complete len:1391 (+),score=340.90 TRINITY_DN39698_c0_g1_i1:70-4242(+)